MIKMSLVREEEVCKYIKVYFIKKLKTTNNLNNDIVADQEDEDYDSIVSDLDNLKRWSKKLLAEKKTCPTDFK